MIATRRSVRVTTNVAPSSRILGLAMAVAFFAGGTNLKIADIQAVEFVVSGTLLILLFSVRSKLQIKGSPVILAAAPQFIILFVLLFIGSILSMRLMLYPIPETGLLKQPPWQTMVRLVEIFISVSTMFIVALAIGMRPERLKKVFAAYIWAAYVSSAWGLISAVGWLVGIKLPGASSGFIPRICGFFVEGGPFGLYLVGAILIHTIRYYYLNYISRREFIIGTIFLLAALVGAQSKSSIVLVMFLIAVYLIVAKRLTAALLISPLIIPLVLTSNVIGGVNGYIESRERFSVLALSDPKDYNLVMGRVMASVLLPRIIAEHPIVGIGIGNYSLVRNDPQILRGLPQTDLWDLPSVGLLGYLAELGIPLSIYLFYIYLYPVLLARGTRPWIAILAAYPLGAAVFGAQLNFAYPWVVMGMVFAALAIHEAGLSPPSENSMPASRIARMALHLRRQD